MAGPTTPNDNDIPKPVPGASSLAGSDRPDITRFLNVRSARSPSLSPDGKQVAFSTRISGQPQLWVVGTEGGWPQQLTFGESVTFHEWSPAGDWIVYGTDRGGNEREGYYLISPDGTRERELLAPSGAFREFGSFTRDGKKVAYATTERNGSDFDIHTIDVATGEDRRIFEGRMGLYARSFRPDGGAVILSEASGEDANIVYLFDLESGELRRLFEPEDRSLYFSFSWRPDGAGFYLGTNHDREMAAVAWFDVKKGELEWIETPEHDVDEVALSHDGRYLAWTTNEDGYSILHLRDLESGESIAAPDLPRGVYAIGWAPGASRLSIRLRGPQVPGDIWTWDPAGAGPAVRATRSATAGLDMEKMVVPEHLSFTARDGVTVHGLLYLPPHRGAAKPPLILAVHGGPTAQARPEFVAGDQYLLTRGIAVFDLNFRGSTGYGKSFARLNDGRLRANELYDLVDAVEFLKKDGRVDTSRAAIMGGSYGGYLTMAAMTRLPGTFRAGVSFVGVSNWITALAGAMPQLRASDRIEYGDVDDPADRAFFEEISPIRHIAGFRGAAMVLHGANDPRDPVTESDAFVAAIRERGGEVEYLRFPDEGHGIRKLSNRTIAYRRIAAFLESKLDPDR